MPNVGRPSRDCYVCRQQRTKCDLTRPECTPCRRKGLACPGYRDELDVLFRPETISSYQSNKGRDRRRRASQDSDPYTWTKASVITTGRRGREMNTNKILSVKLSRKNAPKAATLIRHIPFKVTDNYRDHQSLCHYSVYTTTELSVYPAASFWTDTVIQCSVHEPVVRQCLIALSSGHQHFGLLGKNAVASELLQTASLQEYHNALRQLRKYIAFTAHPRVTVVLISCAILYCAAWVIGRPLDAKTHMQAGSNILRHRITERRKCLSQNQLSEVEVSFDSLWEIFSQMNLQARLFDDSLPPLPFVGPSEDSMQCAPRVPEQFNNLVQAQLVLEILQKRLFQFVVSSNQYQSLPADEVPLSVATEEAALKTEITLWRSSFNEIMGKANSACSEFGTLVRNHIVLLAVQQWTMSIVIQDGLQIHGASPDLTSSTEKICSLLKSHFLYTVQEAAQNVTQSRFISKAGVVPYIYVQLVKYRDRDLQSKALSLLAASQSCEGRLGQNMKMVVQIIELLIAIGKQESQPLHLSDPVEHVHNTGNLERLFGLCGVHKG